MKMTATLNLSKGPLHAPGAGGRRMTAWTCTTPKARKHFRWEAKKGRYTLVITQSLHDGPHHRPAYHRDADGNLVIDWDDLTEIPIEILNRFHLGIVVKPDHNTTLQWTYDPTKDNLTLNPDRETYVGFKTLKVAQDAAEKLPAKLGPIMAGRTRRLATMTDDNSVAVKVESYDAMRRLRQSLQRRLKMSNERYWSGWKSFGVYLLTAEEWESLDDKRGLYAYKSGNRSKKR